METKLEQVSKLYEQTALDVSKSPKKWMAFLDTAAQVYKYGVDDQILIHAQYPDATACAAISVWNKLKRWVKRGTKGIALLDQHGDRVRLKYVFDVSDTQAGRGGKDVRLWTPGAEHMEAVGRVLDANFGVKPDPDFAAMLLTATARAARENCRVYWNDLMRAAPGSALAGMKPRAVAETFLNTVTASVRYTVMARCGISPKQRMSLDAFRAISRFNTADSLCVVGNAAQQISVLLLRQIERAVKAYEQKKARGELAKAAEPAYTKDKREFNELNRESEVQAHGTDLSAGRGLSGSEPDSRGTSGRETGDVRADAREVPQRGTQRPLHAASDQGQAAGSPVGDRPGGRGNAGADRPADGETARRDGTTESGRSDALGAGDEQHPGVGAGDRPARPDLRLTHSEPEKTEGEKSLPSFFAPAVTNEMFRTTPYLKVSKPEIAAFFREHIDPEERKAYTRSIFNEDYTELLIGENDERYGYKASPEALNVWTGSYLSRTAEAFVPWRDVARNFANLIALGEFLDAPAIPEGQLSLLPAEAPGKTIPQDAIDEILRRGDSVQNGKYRITRFFAQNRDPKARADFLKDEYGIGGNPALGNVAEDYSAKGMTLTRGRLTAPDAVVELSWAKVQRRIGELLEADRYLDNAEKKQYHTFLGQEKEEAPETARPASFSAPPEPKLEATAPPTQESLFPSADEQIQQIAAEDVSSSAFSMPQADVDAVLRMGSPYEKSRFRIYEQFRRRQGNRADAVFLKNEYGTAGASVTFADGAEGSTAYSSKGISICRGSARTTTAPDKTLTWEQAAEQIRVLVDGGRYLIPDEEKAYSFWSKGRTEEYAAAERLQVQARPHRPKEKADDGQLSFAGLMGGDSSSSPHPQTVTGPLPAAEENSPETAQKSQISDAGAPETGGDDLSSPGDGSGHAREDAPEETLEDIIPIAADMEEYDALQSARPGEFLAFQVGGYCLLFGEQAEIAAPLIGMKLLELDIPGRGVTKTTGFRANEWQLPVRQLWKCAFDVTVLHQPEPGQRRTADVERKAADYIPLGQKLSIDGRQFTVDAVNWDTGSVSLRDDTFAQGSGFPVFRREAIGYIREQIEAQEKEALRHETPEIGLTSITLMLGAQEPEQTPPEQVRPVPERHNFHITDDALGAGGKKVKYGYNIAAIRLLKTLEAEGRFATPEEQETLSRYVGWGGVPQAFDEQNPQWADEYAELKNLLTDEEYAAARASTLNAHYTSPVVIKAMYKTLARMGFQTGNILEPGCGVGNFFGLLPESMAASKLYGVELDSITGRIAKQLYPNADITISGFERTDQPDSFFDLAVGNVPFGGFKLADHRYNKYAFQIHDYFFAKSLDKVRPGGLIAFITSKGTLDKQSPDVRKYIAQRAELLGAVRLPNTAFAANAGTEVTTDLLFLQRRDRMVYEEPAWVNVSQTTDGVPLNQYYLDHPDMLLGTMVYSKRMYGNEKETTCAPVPGADLAEQLRRALSMVEMPNRDTLETVDVTEPDGEEQSADGAVLSLPADPDVRNFSYTLVDDHLYFRENSRMDLVRDKSDAEAQRIRGMIALRDSTRTLIGLQMDDAADSFIEQEQKSLNGLYDAYTAKYGLLSASANRPRL